MSLKAECAWARVCIRETKALSSSIKRAPGEGTAKYGSRVLSERYKLYCQNFNDYPQLSVDGYQFNRISKIIDEKVGKWRNKGDKEAYLSRFSLTNWSEEKIITKEGKKEHSLSNCKACSSFNSNFQSTFPISKMCMTVNKGPLSELQQNVKKHTQRIKKITKKQLREIGQNIYSSYDEKCKENLGHSLSEILVLVPEAGLERKPSPVEKRKLKRNQQREWKKDLENSTNANDTDIHLSSRESYMSRKNRRLDQCFETIAEATERARLTPPKVKK